MITGGGVIAFIAEDGRRLAGYCGGGRSKGCRAVRSVTSPILRQQHEAQFTATRPLCPGPGTGRSRIHRGRRVGVGRAGLPASRGSPKRPLAQDLRAVGRYRPRNRPGHEAAAPPHQAPAARLGLAILPSHSRHLTGHGIGIVLAFISPTGSGRRWCRAWHTRSSRHRHHARGVWSRAQHLRPHCNEVGRCGRGADSTLRSGGACGPSCSLNSPNVLYLGLL